MNIIDSNNNNNNLDNSIDFDNPSLNLPTQYLINGMSYNITLIITNIIANSEIQLLTFTMPPQLPTAMFNNNGNAIKYYY